MTNTELLERLKQAAAAPQAEKAESQKAAMAKLRAMIAAAREKEGD